MLESCHVTVGLLDALLELAAEREPESVSTLLAVTSAGELERADDAPGNAAKRPARGGTQPAVGGSDARVEALDPETPVFTDFYVPSAGRSVDAVFGVDVSIPHAQAQGRFVSHPLGERSVSTTDDLHEVVLVAVPPWTRDDVAAFDRSGRRLELHVLSAAPPERPFEG